MNRFIALVFLVVTLVAAFDPTGYGWVSFVDVGDDSGFVRLVLSPDVLDGASPDLNDLRLQDERSELVPYVLRVERWEDVARTVWRNVELINETFAPSEYARVTLDFGVGAQRRNQIRVSLGGENYRRKAMVEASDNGETWEMVVQEQWLFLIRQPDGEFELDVINFPSNDQQYLRLTVYNMPDDPDHIQIQKVEAALTETLPKAELTEVPVVAMTGPVREKHTNYNAYGMDLGYRNLPVAQIELDVYDDYFYRGYELWGRNAETEEVVRPYESGSRKITQDVPWRLVNRGILYRVKDSENMEEKTSIVSVSAPYRYLELRTFDGDNPPLQLHGAMVLRRDVSLVFKAQAGAKYWLWFGNPSATAPNFDLARAVPELRDNELPVVCASKPSQVADEPQMLPWTERNRVLIWGLLLLVVAAVLTVILRSLKESRSGD